MMACYTLFRGIASGAVTPQKTPPIGRGLFILLLGGWCFRRETFLFKPSVEFDPVDVDTTSNLYKC